MQKRWSLILGLALVSAGVVGCDGDDPTDAGCDPEAGIICPDMNDGGPTGDGGPLPDTGVMEGCQIPPAVGAIGGRCRTGGTCQPSLECFEEVTRFPTTGAAITLRNLFEIPTAVENAEGELEIGTGTGFPDIPVGFGPGGQCSNTCDPEAMTDTCGECASCSSAVGGSSNFGAIGLRVSSFTSTEMRPVSGICRANCAFDVDTPGGCPADYTCSASSGVCLEQCVNDAQCNFDWNFTRHEGLVAEYFPDGNASCDSATRRCRWTTPPGAAVGTECSRNSDCPADIGTCFLGRCTTQLCNVPAADGMTPRYPCDEGNFCLGLGGGLAVCSAACDSPGDCLDGQACLELDGGAGGACTGFCTDNDECQSSHYCRRGMFATDDLGICDLRCDLEGDDCAEGEACQADGDLGHGYCVELNGICRDDSGCAGTQACEHLANDELGICIDGCQTNEDCTEEGAQCRRQLGADCSADADVCEAHESCDEGTCRSNYGVCRTPGNACSQDDRRTTDGDLFNPLRGSRQCILTERCNSTSNGMVGACVPCGAEAGDDCCPSGACGVGLLCDTADNECVVDADACGLEGIACCEAPAEACEGSLECDEDICVAPADPCGDLTQACCEAPEDPCNAADLICDASDVCVTCGAAAGQPCCDGGTCEGALTCTTEAPFICED